MKVERTADGVVFGGVTAEEAATALKGWAKHAGVSLGTAPGNLNQVSIPYFADDALVWAVGREFDMRANRYRTARMGAAGAMAKMAKAANRFRDAVMGLDATGALGAGARIEMHGQGGGGGAFVCPPQDPPGCKCGGQCEFPCWQRDGIAGPCTDCGCHLSAVEPVTEEAG